MLTRHRRILVSLRVRRFAADTGVWKVAPPPPASWQRDRVADLAARRKAAMDQIGEHGVLILYAAEAAQLRQRCRVAVPPGEQLLLSDRAHPARRDPGAGARRGKMREMVFLPASDPFARKLDRPHDHAPLRRARRPDSGRVRRRAVNGF